MKHSPRHSQRLYLSYYLRIYRGDEFLGFLMDVSDDGVMIMREIVANYHL